MILNPDPCCYCHKAHALGTPCVFDADDLVEFEGEADDDDREVEYYEPGTMRIFEIPSKGSEKWKP